MFPRISYADSVTALKTHKMAEDGLDLIRDVLVDVQLSQFLIPLRDDLQITRLEHFDYVTPSDLENIGLSKPGNNKFVFN